VTDQPLPAGRFAAGQSLDRYQIVAPLGTGGMGEVYRARDVRLAREVAVKVLPASLASDPERLRRFEREARATGSLDHPNVLVVHDVGTQDETSYLVTELLEGETLRERMEAGPVPASRALEIGAGVARGLSAAHQKGIVHRDLKPDNVFLTRDGRVKILDFGLAKITGPLGVDPDAQTLAAADRGTMPGLLLGTAGYMSPEQVRGGEADPRSDVFALGVILYELLWDRRAFAEASKVETLSAILRTDPLEAPTPPTVSPSLLDIVRRCLEKDPEERFQSARDLAFALEALGAAEESGSTRSVMTVRRRPGGPPSRLARTGRALVLAGLSALAALFGERILVPGPLPRIVGFRALVGGLPRSPETWTTDGERVYYTIDREGRHEVYQVPLRGGEPSRLETPFEQARVLDASARRSAILVLGWDGGLTAWQSRDQTLWILPVPAGAARNTGLEGLAAAWSPDGERLAFSGGSDDYSREAAGALFVAGGDGSEPRLVWRGDAEIPWVRWSPDGRRLRFDVFDRGASEWWIMEVPVDGGPSTPRRVVRGERGAFAPDGRSFVFGRWAPSDPSAASGGPRFDLYVRAEGRGAFLHRETEPRPLTFGPLDFATPAFTPSGRQIVAAGTLRRMELLRYAASRSRFERVADPSGAFVAYSRDGQWVAWVDPASMTLWRSRRDGSGRLQLTVPPMAVGLVRWSPDGGRLLFVADPSGRGQPRAVYLVPRDGGRLESFADPLSNPVWDPCWLDASTVAWGNLRGDGAAVWTADLATKRVAMLPGSAGMMGAKCARDGKVLAARSWTEGYWLYRPETGRWTDLGSPSNLWYPTFARDGSTVYGLSRDDRAIYRFRLDDPRRVKVAELGTIEPTAPWQEVWMGLDPDDAPLILRNTGFSDLFVLDWASR
jgi:Tol biopolymer transport system component